MNEQLYQARRRCAPPFLRYLQKTWGGGGGRKSTPPGCARVKLVYINIVSFFFSSTDTEIPKYRYRMTEIPKVPKYRNRMTRFQVPNTDTAGTKKVPNPSSGWYMSVSLKRANFFLVIYQGWSGFIRFIRYQGIRVHYGPKSFHGPYAILKMAWWLTLSGPLCRYIVTDLLTSPFRGLLFLKSRQRTLWKSSDIFWSVHHNTLTDTRPPSPLGDPHYTRSLALLNCRRWGPAPYIGPQIISRTFLIIPENSGTLYRRPFLDRSRQRKISREAARHFRNVPKCAVFRNYVITEWRNLNTLCTIQRDAGETQNIIRNNILPTI